MGLLPSTTLEVVQNSRPRMVFIMTLGDRDGTYPSDTPRNIQFAFMGIMVKWHTDDPDERAIFSPWRNPPLPYGFDLLFSTPLSPINGQFAFEFNASHTMLAPGDYPCEIMMWDDAASFVAGDVARERIPCVWRVRQTLDLPAPGT